jgi:hypothetical protein
LVIEPLQSQRACAHLILIIAAEWLGISAGTDDRAFIGDAELGGSIRVFDHIDAADCMPPDHPSLSSTAHPLGVGHRPERGASTEAVDHRRAMS